MVLVNSSNDALAAAVRKAKQAFKVTVQTNFAVAINKSGEKSFNLVLASISQSGCKANYLDHVVITKVGEIRQKLIAFARNVEVPSIDLVFLNEPNDGEFRMKWTLVDPETLTARLVGGSKIESLYNPV